MTFDTVNGTDRTTGPTPNVASLGSELITNGDFTSDASGWTTTGWTWTSGKMVHNASNTNPLKQSINITAGVIYQVLATISGSNPLDGESSIYIDGEWVTNYNSIETEVPGTNYGQFVATRTATVDFEVRPTGGFVGGYDAISVKPVSTPAKPIFIAAENGGNMVGSIWGNDSSNLGLGVDNLKFITTGYLNTAIGKKALNQVMTGFDNTAVGAYSQSITGVGWGNTSLGANSLRYNTSGSLNTAVGSQAMQNNGGGFYNCAFGRAALFSNSIGIQNVAIGVNALYGVIGNYNIGVGSNALGSSNNSGTHNNSIGVDSMRALTTGTWNEGHGYEVLRYLTTGNKNVAIGHQAVMTITTHSNNTGVGGQALSNILGANNTAIGCEAALNQTAGDGNIAIGYQADLPNSTGSNQLSLGNTIYGDLANKNIGIGQTTWGTSATKTLALSTGVAPTTSPGDAFQMYSKDITSGNAAPHFRTEGGQEIKLYKVNDYTLTNTTTDRGLDGSTVTLSELANIVGTLITDLRSTGLVG